MRHAVNGGVGSGVVDTASLATTTLPDVGIDVYLSPTAFLVTASVGIASVAVTPLLVVRRLQRMNLPGTLRVVE